MNNEVHKNQQQSIDSSKPNFAMPDDWHGRKVDAIEGRHIAYDLRIIGWDASGQTDQPYCVTDEEGWTFWTVNIRFADGDACDWSDDDTVEPC